MADEVGLELRYYQCLQSPAKYTVNAGHDKSDPKLRVQYSRNEGNSFKFATCNQIQIYYR
jgi:hypothetical protein